MAIKFDTSHNITCYRLKELSAATQIDFTTDHEVVCKELVEGKNYIEFMGQSSAGELQCASIIENNDEIYGSEEDKKKAEEAAEESEIINRLNNEIKPILMDFIPEIEGMDNVTTSAGTSNNIVITNIQDLISQIYNITGDTEENILSRLHWFLIEERPCNRGRGSINRSKFSHRQKKISRRFIKSAFQTNRGEFEKTGDSTWKFGSIEISAPSADQTQYASIYLPDHYERFINTNAQSLEFLDDSSGYATIYDFSVFLDGLLNLRKTYTYSDIINDHGDLRSRTEAMSKDLFMYLGVGIGLEYREETPYSHKKIFAYTRASNKCLKIPFVQSTKLSITSTVDINEKALEIYNAELDNGYLSDVDPSYILGAVPDLGSVENDISTYIADWTANDN